MCSTTPRRTNRNTIKYYLTFEKKSIHKYTKDQWHSSQRFSTLSTFPYLSKRRPIQNSWHIFYSWKSHRNRNRLRVKSVIWGLEHNKSTAVLNAYIEIYICVYSCITLDITSQVSITRNLARIVCTTLMINYRKNQLDCRVDMRTIIC